MNVSEMNQLKAVSAANTVCCKYRLRQTTAAANSVVYGAGKGQSFPAPSARVSAASLLFKPCHLCNVIAKQLIQLAVTNPLNHLSFDIDAVVLALLVFLARQV